MRLSSWFVIPFLAWNLLGAQALAKAAVREAQAAVGAVLDDWHLAAAQAEEERYFSHLAPGAVFMGLDAEERWEKEAFRRWAHPGFAARRMWRFQASRRTVALSPDGLVAWFDEQLDTSTMGLARGSGVLVKLDGTWQIAQYALSLPIPAAAYSEVRQMIELLRKDQAKAKDAKRPPENQGK